jgi:hypothetical protein
MPGISGAADGISNVPRLNLHWSDEELEYCSNILSHICDEGIGSVFNDDPHESTFL